MTTTPKPGRTGLAVVVLVAALARFGVAAWAGGRFSPVGDGVYYNTLALRIAEGLGYTWRWPDGAVTFAAHYPVGYPALLAAAYRLVGAAPATAGVLAALLGVAAAAAMHRVALVSAGPRAALGAGLAVALDPGLVFYTPVLMTEGVTASLLAIAALAIAGARVAANRSTGEGAREAADRSTGEAARGAADRSTGEGVRGTADRSSSDESVHSTEPKPSRAPLFATLAGVPSRAPLFAALAGVVLGVATLVRPQSLLFAPFFGALAAAPGARLQTRARDALIALTLSVAVCTPWTLRNCSRMGRCALVSLNGGWNLLIGATPSAKGTWAPLEVPEACRLVFDEAKKDECFAQAARERIAAEPGAWLSLLPAKWSSTFDHVGAAPGYLHEANPGAFSEEAKQTLSRTEAAFARGALVVCLLAIALARGPRRLARAALAVVGIACAFGAHPYPGYLALVAAAALLGRSLAREHLLAAFAAIVIAGTAIVHGAFFGAGRYALVVSPFVMALAGAATAGAPWREAVAGAAGAPWREALASLRERLARRRDRA